jgi:hypothetical protein
LQVAGVQLAISVVAPGDTALIVVVLPEFVIVAMLGLSELYVNAMLLIELPFVSLTASAICLEPPGASANAISGGFVFWV